MRTRRVYLDYQASTPCDPRVVEAMLPFLVGYGGNPASPHWAGDEAEEAVEHARETIAAALGCSAAEVTFTSGATESNNLALFGCASAASASRRKIVTTPIEHKSILLPASHLSRTGFKLVKCPVRSDGRVDLGALAELVDEETLLVSIQLANNEVGTLQPLLEVCQIAHRVGALVHTDAAQALGRLSIDVESLGVDLLSLSSHKAYGPKGVGCLYVRRGIGSSAPKPILFGGGQEAGLRPGTPNVPGIVGMGRAVQLSVDHLAGESRRLNALRDAFETAVRGQVEELTVNGAVGMRLPGVTSLTFHGIDADALLANLPELAISSSSACTSGAPEPSHVLLALGLSRREAYSTIRASVGRYTTRKEVDYAAARIAAVARSLRTLLGSNLS